MVKVELMLDGCDGGLEVGDDCGESVAVNAESVVHGDGEVSGASDLGTGF